MPEEVTVRWDDEQQFGVGLWLMGHVLLDRLGDRQVEQTNPLSGLPWKLPRHSKNSLKNPRVTC